MTVSPFFERNRYALGLLGAAYRLFPPHAPLDATILGQRSAELEALYRATVRHCGRELETPGQRDAGRRERMARRALALARELGMAQHQMKTILLGVYLRDIGMVRVPRAIVDTTAPLTAAERELVRMHPLWGVEMLADIDFPWDVKPIVRWHHERCDGTGYPDGLPAARIPVAAQVVGILDTFDALTRHARPPSVATVAGAVAEVGQRRAWWSPAVFRAFNQVMQQPALGSSSRPSPDHDRVMSGAAT